MPTSKLRREDKKANEIREKYRSEDLDFVAEKLGADVVEHPLGRVSKGAYFKDLGVIVIDPNLHPFKKRNPIAHDLAHHLFHRKGKQTTSSMIRIL